MGTEQFKQTKFDSMLTNQNMQLVKAVIPYIDNSLGTYIGMYVKLQELQNAAKINSRIAVAAMNADKPGDFSGLFEDIKDFMSDEDKEMIDTMMMMMEMMNAEGGNPEDFMGNYMNMFNGSE